MQDGRILYEDNHLLVVNKRAGEIVQGDKTGDQPLSEAMKAYIKTKYAKPGEVFLGVVHRIDRPVSGVCLFARTSKALARLNDMFARKLDSGLRKTYLAIVPLDKRYECKNTRLENWLTRNERLNKTFVAKKETPGAKLAVMDFDVVRTLDRYMLIEVHLHTGRHHQIRCQLAAIGLPIKGDLKYGAPRSNPDGNICLHAWRLTFTHPVKKEPLTIEAPMPQWFKE